jgi:hypothetical protein
MCLVNVTCSAGDDWAASLGVTITTAAAQVNPRNRSIVRPDVRMVAPCHKTAA